MTHISRHRKDGGGGVAGKNIYEPYNLIYASSGQRQQAEKEVCGWTGRQRGVVNESHQLELNFPCKAKKSPGSISEL